jgi:hypothetical protein
MKRAIMKPYIHESDSVSTPGEMEEERGKV